jgi:hypothetical protein
MNQHSVCLAAEAKAPSYEARILTDACRLSLSSLPLQMRCRQLHHRYGRGVGASALMPLGMTNLNLISYVIRFGSPSLK